MKLEKPAADRMVQATDLRPTNEAGEKRLGHIRAHLASGFDLDRLIFNVENNAGSPVNCMALLASHALASAMLAWFERGDLVGTRLWCYVVARLDREVMTARDDKTAPFSKLLSLLSPLISNNADLIDWFANSDWLYHSERIENHKTADFQAFQGIVALRGDWDRLIERCDRLEDDPPVSLKRYVIDNQFYRALAIGDLTAMQEAIGALCTPRVHRDRSNHQSGYTDGLVSTYAVIYAKIAWRHGYHVDIGSPYVPQAWLQNTPLPRYDGHYRFLSSSD